MDNSGVAFTGGQTTKGKMKMNYLKLTTPLNIAEEKERFFNSDIYEP